MSMEIGAGVTSQIMDLKTSTPGVTRKEEIKTGFQEVNDYVKYLQEKYSYMNAGIVSMKGIPTTVSVSPAFLKKCMDNPEKAAFLEENLAAIPQCTERSIAGCMCTLTRQGWEIDANGNITAWSCGTSDPDGKVAKENAKVNEVNCTFELNTADKLIEKYDFVCANILHNVLYEIMGDLKNIMKDDINK